MDEIHYRVIL